MFTSWSGRSGSRAAGRSHPRRPAARPALLRLEDRTVPATIAGTVYADLNGNGLFDPGEAPIAGSTVELRNSGGTVINSGTTGPAGTYSFATDNTVNTAPTTLQQTATVPLTATDFGTTVGIPQFDPSRGTLTAITIELTGSVAGSIQFENLDSTPTVVTGTLQARIDLSRPDESLLVSVLPAISVNDTVAAFDGQIDFGGSSGRTFTGLGSTDSGSTGAPPPASDLALFTGTGTVDLLLSAVGLSTVSGGSNLATVVNTAAAAAVTVTYTYVPSNAIRPGDYTVVQTAQPAGFLDGRESRGGAVLPGSVGTDTIAVSIEAPTEVSAGNDFGELPPARLAGFVYADADDDGVFDPGEAPVPGATVTLTGADDLGSIAPVVVQTGPAGAYVFPNLRLGTYTITESQPAGFFDGRDTQGTPGNGSPGNDTFGGIALGVGVSGANNNFGEIAIRPAINVVKLTNGTDNDAAPGPVVPVGSTVTFTYVVTNPGNVALSGVTVRDDAGTPGDPADDFTATFTGGDNENGLLDLTETWTFTASRVATAGQHTNVATATGTATAGGGTASATDPDNHFGAAPAVRIVKLTNGTDNDTAPGPVVPVGSTVTFTYVVTNPGSVPLSGVTVADDNGTPGDPADDFTATFVGGDANTDGLLDLAETWTFTASRVATAGQHTNVATAAGTPPPGGGAPVTATDPDNHFGATPGVRLVALTNGTDNNSAPGPVVTVGKAVGFVYLVTSRGGVPLSAVTVRDDNGTAGDPADDFNAAFAGGDTNGDGLLDPAETWVFSASRVVTAGQHTNVATVTAQPPAPGPAVTAADAENHFGFVPVVVAGAGPGASPQVRLFNADGSVRATIQAFDPGFLGGVRVAVGDVTGDGVNDVVAGAGPGAGSHVKVFDGVTNAEVRSFFAFPGFAGGVFVGAGDVDRDGLADVIVGAGAGAAPHVKVFSGATGAELRSFFAFPADFAGGVTVAGGDLNLDGRADVIVGAGPGAGPHVKVFDGATNAELRSFFAFAAGFAGGVFVGAGDVDCDGRAEIVVGAGPGAGPHVKVFDGESNAELRSFFAFAPGSAGGVRVAAGELNTEGMADLIVGAGTGSEVKALDGMTLAELFDEIAFGAATQGVFVG